VRVANSTFIVALALALGGCPGEEGENAPTVWLAPDGSEIRVRLIEEEPRPW
jgi:hypothetical protein